MKKSLIQNLSILLSLFLSTHAMDQGQHQPDPFKTVPCELLYKIVEQWPALNVYRLLSKYWHTLTSYTQAESVVRNGGAYLIGNHDRQQLLYTFIKEGKTEPISLLLEQYPIKDSELMFNPYYYNPSAEIRAILKKHAILDSGHRNRLIHEAAFHGDITTLEKIYQLQDLETPNKLTMTPLICAIAGNQYSTTQFLLKKGAATTHNTNHCSESINSALHVAAECADPNIIQLLCAHIKEHRYYNTDDEVNAVRGQKTPVCRALYHGRTFVSTMLIDNGALVNADANHNSSLLTACEHARGDLVELLLEHKINPELGENFRSCYCCPLLKAADKNYVHIARQLLAAGARVNGTNPESNQTPTPLIQAAYRGHEQMVLLLLDNGADQSLTFKGKTALHIAQERGYTLIATLLRNYKKKNHS